MLLRLISCIAVISAFAFTVSVGGAAVTSASPDGEATVYLLGDFSGNFDIVYRGTLKPGPANKSWSTLSILLVGSRIPGPGVSVGLAEVPSHRGAIKPFTYVVYPGATDDYVRHSMNCDVGCVLELRGDPRNVYAYVDGRRLGSWSRSDLYLRHPYVQLNAEVHEAGDSIRASLTAVRPVVAAGLVLHPTCGFTTRGIVPAGHRTIAFRGTTDNARATYTDLLTGARKDKC